MQLLIKLKADAIINETYIYRSLAMGKKNGVVRCILLSSWHLRYITTPYIKHKAGSFFSLLYLVSRSTDRILFTTGHLVDNLFFTSNIQLSAAIPSNDPCRKTEGSVRQATSTSSLLALSIIKTEST